MKKLLFNLLFVLLTTTGCEKDKPVKPAVQQPVPPPLPINSLQSLVWVVSNAYVAYPADSCMLTGYAPLNNSNVSYLWKKVTGPASFNIADPKSLKTKVDKLQVGEYAFELKAIDVNGKEGSATLSVYVIKPGQNETIFKSLAWSCPMGCGIFLKNIYSFIPRNKPIKVFLRTANSSSNWLPVMPSSQWTGSDDYTFGIDSITNTFSMYANDADGTVDVKIEY